MFGHHLDHRWSHLKVSIMLQRADFHWVFIKCPQAYLYYSEFYKYQWRVRVSDGRRRGASFFFFFFGALRATSSASCHVSETVTLTLAGQ